MGPNSRRTAFDLVSKARRANVTTNSPSKETFREHVKCPMRKAAAGDHILGEKHRNIDTQKMHT